MSKKKRIGGHAKIIDHERTNLILVDFVFVEFSNFKLNYNYILALSFHNI